MPGYFINFYGYSRVPDPYYIKAKKGKTGKQGSGHGRGFISFLHSIISREVAEEMG